MRRFLSASGRKGGVLGLSGGVDSAVVAKLAAMAFGKEKTCALIMPGKSTAKTDIEHAVSFAKSLGIEYHISDISSAIASLCAASQKTRAKIPSKKCLGNMTARARMALLYDFAGREDYLVLGTSNRSELMLGYFTKYGDGASDVLPIGALYKTEVYQLARHLKIPRGIIEKPPSAGLWPDQTDEKEIGMPYERIDPILRELAETAENGKPMKMTIVARRIAEMISSSRHKRHSPPILEPFSPQA